MKEEKKTEYRIISKRNWNWGICYIAERYKTLFLGIGYWERLSESGIEGRYTKFKYKEDAEKLIEDYKNNRIEEKSFGIEGYY